MAKLKLVSESQAREVGKLARDMKLSREAFQTALTDGAVEQFLQSLLSKKLQYPDWVKERLTPEHEVTELADPGKVELWLNPHQSSSPYLTGPKVYEAVKDNNFLERSLSYGHLKWYEENHNQIQAEFQGKLIYGWASVVHGSGGVLSVPYLNCDVDRPYVRWHGLGRRWLDHELAGLRK